jgi:hypothetical protein
MLAPKVASSVSPKFETRMWAGAMNELHNGKCPFRQIGCGLKYAREDGTLVRRVLRVSQIDKPKKHNRIGGPCCCRFVL